ncbi:unnamed protein product [Rangifer tarandus platyrhynchus]|uniref:Uncharacterized protein n=3 Tax=Rangifer tarandus platyrhynchus TaxID=3082113 RepID=A0ABN9A0U9_RANTA|nr:unnamed protein product [Rangifer tarandus platyrhynchus]CAI9713807.1 unnamed protein product [Rangifer tarandus platyrhynchus]
MPPPTAPLYTLGLDCYARVGVSSAAASRPRRRVPLGAPPSRPGRGAPAQSAQLLPAVCTPRPGRLPSWDRGECRQG